MKRLFFIFAVLFSSVPVFAQKAIRVKEMGKKADAIIFLPNIGCSSEMWQEIAKNYSKNYTCYLVDLAGFNGQRTIDTLYTENYVNDLRVFIKKEKLKNVILVV